MDTLLRRPQYTPNPGMTQGEPIPAWLKGQALLPPQAPRAMQGPPTAGQAESQNFRQGFWGTVGRGADAVAGVAAVPFMAGRGAMNDLGGSLASVVGADRLAETLERRSDSDYGTAMRGVTGQGLMGYRPEMPAGQSAPQTAPAAPAPAPAVAATNPGAGPRRAAAPDTYGMDDFIRTFEGTPLTRYAAMTAAAPPPKTQPKASDMVGYQLLEMANAQAAEQMKQATTPQERNAVFMALMQQLQMINSPEAAPYLQMMGQGE